MNTPTVVALAVVALVVLYFVKTTIGVVKFSGRVLMFGLLLVVIIGVAFVLKNKDGDFRLPSVNISGDTENVDR